MTIQKMIDQALDVVDSRKAAKAKWIIKRAGRACIEQGELDRKWKDNIGMLLAETYRRVAGLHRMSATDLIERAEALEAEANYIEGVKTVAIYTDAEYDQLYYPQEQPRRHRKLRDGVTREQAQRMFKRRDADWEAANRLYGDGTTVKLHLDGLIADGFTHVIRVGRWMYLSKDGDGNKPRLDSRVEMDYIKTALDLGEFKRNY